MENYEQLLISLRRIIRAIDIHSRHLQKISGLTGPQLIVMKKIAQLDAPLAKLVAQEIDLSAATVTSIIDRLEKQQLVIRQRSTVDKRKVHLFLSDTGQELLQTSPKPLQEHFIQRYQALDKKSQLLLLDSVEQIASMMNAETLDAAAILTTGLIQNETYDK